MKLRNKSKLNTKELRKQLYAAAQWFGISTVGLLVEVKDKESLWGRNGSFYGSGGKAEKILLYVKPEKNNGGCSWSICS